MPKQRAGRLVRVLALPVGLALAVAATAALVLTEDLQLLRLAVIVALWAFLIAAFVAGQRRTGKDAAPEQGAEIAVRRSAELELEREVATRREFELRTEVRLRREVEGGLREDVATLRGDLERLRRDILERWDGELRVERVAVRAESTRVSGFGATFHALQDEARRLHDEGRPMFEVEAEPPRLDALDTASTVEFSVVPPAPTVEDVAAGVASAQSPARPAAYPPAVPSTATGSTGAQPVRAAAVDTDPVLPRTSPEGRRRRDRQHAGDEEPSVDASSLLRRLKAETGSPAAQAAPPRRRRYRDDDETNDVLSRILRR